MKPFGIDISDKRALLKQIGNFAWVGGLAFLIDWALLYVFTDWIGIHYLISNALSFTIATIINFFMSVRWVFDVADGHKKRSDFWVFFVLSVVGLLISQVLMYVFVDLCGIYYMLSKALK